MNGGTIYFDASCGICQSGVRRFGDPLTRRGYRFCPLQSKEAQDKLGLRPGEMPDEVKVLTPDGRILGGADAILHLIGGIWWGRPTRLLARLPGGLRLLHWAYRLIAGNRHCISGACRVRSHDPGPGRSLISHDISFLTDNSDKDDGWRKNGGVS